MERAAGEAGGVFQPNGVSSLRRPAGNAMLGPAMMPLMDHPLYTPRLRIEPVTPELAAAARAGEAVFADVIGADAPPEWCAASLGLVAKSVSEAWGPTPRPIRAVAIHHAEGCIVGDVRFEPSLRRKGRAARARARFLPS